MCLRGGVRELNGSMGVSPMFAVLPNLAGTADKKHERSDLARFDTMCRLPYSWIKLL
jgi:hypothetical protein